ncbi:hypothetical protein [Tomitella gaofuii]|uniref:hypothetical protein n=1 Tax=Tomitella gaofuii TaxID=2760083 RepID=UPI0015FAA556|nr:hypothetical protein [Tomitella gaofuii]
MNFDIWQTVERLATERRDLVHTTTLERGGAATIRWQCGARTVVYFDPVGAYGRPAGAVAVEQHLPGLRRGITGWCKPGELQDVLLMDDEYHREWLARHEGAGA